ncbi:MAG: hypothetical protein D6815_02035, partial [Candidatus Dadabacteria bacterium]
MAFVLALARLRGAELLGQYSLVMTCYLLGRTCVTLGLPVVLTRETARQPESAGRMVTHGLLVSGGFAAGIFLVAIVAARTLTADAGIQASVALTAATLLPAAALGTAEAVFLGLTRVNTLLTLTIIESASRAAAGLLAVLMGFGLPALCAAVLFSATLTAGAAMYRLLQVRAAPVRRVDRAFVRSLLSELWTLGPIPFVSLLSGEVAVLALTATKSWTELGYYAAARRLVDIAATISRAYTRAAYPRFSEHIDDDERAFGGFVRSSL